MTATILKLKPFDGYAWPALPNPKWAPLWSLYQTLEETQWLSPEALEARQFTQLQVLLEHSARHAPYYRTLFQEHGIRLGQIQGAGDLGRIPMLSRSVLQRRYAEFKAETLPAGTVAVGEGRTSGSTGEPVNVGYTNITRLWWLALFLRDITWCGMDPEQPMVAIRTRVEDDKRPLRAEAWHPVLKELLRWPGFAYLLSVRMDPHEQLRWLQQLRPGVMLGYPSNMAFLASLSLEAGLTWPDLEVVQVISEAVSPAARRQIEDAFGAAVRNTYSCVEFGYLASPCPEGRGFHVHSESVLTEVVDDQGRQCAPGESGWLVVTALQNYITPLIRYALRDRVTLAPGPCSCGRGLPLLQQVEGKARPLFLLRDGARKDSTDFFDKLQSLAGFHQIQVIQHTGERFTIRIVPAGAYSAATEADVVALLKHWVGANINVNVETMPRIPTDTSGKFRSIIVEA